jgi:glycine betaine/proline transport system ATP-binding protein
VIERGGTVDPVLAVDRVWKVFGAGKLDRALALAADGITRAEILDATGCVVAVRDVSFTVQRGETFVVMGLSGSGKSTLVRCLARLVEPTRGGVTIDGEDFLAMDAATLRAVRRTKLSMVFQHFGLFPHRRVIDNVAYGLEVQGIGRAERHARAREVLAVVGLEQWERRFPQQLSGGMQQRVGLARALALDPEILFFDEPFSALDPLIRRDMQDELLRLQESLHCTIVFITHDFGEALRLGDRIAIMKDGVFDQIGTPEQLVTQPATDYVAEFTKDVSKANVLSARAVMRPTHIAAAGPYVDADAPISEIIPLLLDGHSSVTVIDTTESVVGVLDGAAVARMLAGDTA